MVASEIVLRYKICLECAWFLYILLVYTEVILNHVTCEPEGVGIDKVHRREVVYHILDVLRHRWTAESHRMEPWGVSKVEVAVRDGDLIKGVYRKSICFV